MNTVEGKFLWYEQTYQRKNDVQNQVLKVKNPQQGVSFKLDVSRPSWITRLTVFSVFKFILFHASECNRHTNLIISFPNVWLVYLQSYIGMHLYTFKENEVRRHQLFKNPVFVNAADPFQMRKNPRRADWSAPSIWFYSSLALLALPPSQGWIRPDKALGQLVLVST